MYGMIAVGVLVALIVMWLMGTYNGLVTLRNMMQEGWSGIDVQLKRRFDLIPNLVETVKGYATHEKETLENVTAARTAVSNAGNDTEARLQAENMLTSTLRTLFAVSENYPDLKANTNFLQLQEQLASIENDLQLARRYYNGTVRNLNTTIQRFPAVLIARQFGFTEAPFFEVEEEAKVAPKVSF
ncbi:MAG: LemA family protein [Synergistaceae bacterium]